MHGRCTLGLELRSSRVELAKRDLPGFGVPYFNTFFFLNGTIMKYKFYTFFLNGTIMK